MRKFLEITSWIAIAILAFEVHRMRLELNEFRMYYFQDKLSEPVPEKKWDSFPPKNPEMKT